MASVFCASAASREREPNHEGAKAKLLRVQTRIDWSFAMLSIKETKI